MAGRVFRVRCARRVRAREAIHVESTISGGGRVDEGGGSDDDGMKGRVERLCPRAGSWAYTSKTRRRLSRPSDTRAIVSVGEREKVGMDRPSRRALRGC